MSSGGGCRTLRCGNDGGITKVAFCFELGRCHRCGHLRRAIPLPAYETRSGIGEGKRSASCCPPPIRLRKVEDQEHCRGCPLMTNMLSSAAACCARLCRNCTIADLDPWVDA